MVLSLAFMPFYSRDRDYNQPLSFVLPSSQPSITFSTDPILGAINPSAAKLIVLDVNGSYNFNENALIKVQDLKGNIVINFPVRSVFSLNFDSENQTLVYSFPITINLPNEGTYFVSLENVAFDPGTYMMAYSPYVQQDNLLSDLQYPGYFIFLIGSILFSSGWISTIFNCRKKERNSGLFFIEKKFVSPRNNLAILFTSNIFFALLCFLLWKNNFPNALLIISLIVILSILYSYFSIRKLLGIELVSFEKISLIEENAKMCIILSSVLLSISLALTTFTLLILSNSFLFFFGLVLYFEALGILVVMVPFFSLLTSKGRLVLTLRKFIKDFNKSSNETDFALLSIIARKIATLVRVKGFMISSTALTAGLYDSVVTSKKTSRIEELLKVIENEQSGLVEITPILKDFLLEGSKLENQSITAKPSFFEKYSITYLASALAIILTIINILRFVLDIM